MNDDKNKEMVLDNEQLGRRSKRRAQEVIGRWCDYVHSVGGGDCSDDFHSSSTGIYGDSSEDDDSIISEEASERESEGGSLGRQGDSGGEQDLLSEVWGPFLRRGTAYEARRAKRSKLNSPADSGTEEFERDLGSSSGDDDSASEGSDGSYGSLADFIC